MLELFVGFLPLLLTAYFLYFRIKYHSNNFLLVLIFLSYFIFATNYESYGLSFDLYRYIHRTIGVLLVINFIYDFYKNGIKILSNPIFMLSMFYFIAIVVSYIGNDIFLPHYIHYMRNFIFIFIIMLFIYYKLENKNNLEELFRLVVDITLILSICVVVETLLKSEMSRAFLFYPNPNYLGISLLFGFSIVLFRETKLKYFKIIIFLVAIYLTGSRAIELAVVFLFLLRVFQYRKTLQIKYVLLISSIVIIVFFSYMDKILINQDNRGVRVGLTKISLNIVEKNIVNGIGYGQFRTKFADYFDSEIRSMNITELNNKIDYNEEMMTHNDFLKIITELGLIGFCFILFYFYKIYFELKKLILFDKEYFYLSISLILGSITFSMFHNNISSFIFWFILFLPFILTKVFKIDKKERSA